MTNKKTLAYLSLTIASIIWGANGPIMKYVLQTIPPFTLALIRFGGASAVLFPFVLNKLSIAKKDRINILLVSLFGVSLNIGFYFLGLKTTTALNAGIIVASLPIFTLIFAAIFLKEKVKKNFVFGSVLGLLGILVIISKDILLTTFSPIGDFLILLATLSYVFYEILSKKLKHYSPVLITFYMFLIASATFFPFAFLEFQSNPYWIYKLSFSVILGSFYGIFFSSICAYVLWQWALWQLQATRVGFFFYLDPIVSTITAVLFLSEQITPAFLFGSIFIFLGLFIAEGHIKHYHIINLFHK